MIHQLKMASSLNYYFYQCFIILLSHLIILSCHGDIMLNSSFNVEDEVSSNYGYGHGDSSLAYPSYVVLSSARFDKVGSRFLASVTTVNVDGFGAKGDGKTDDTQAFKKAWDSACSSKGAILVVPKQTYMLKPITFYGPCQSSLTVEVQGSIVASVNRGDYKQDLRKWIVFNSVDNLIVQGGGTINGNGKIWWQNSCKVNKALSCTDAPTAVTFYKCKKLTVKNIKIQDAQQIQVSFQGCTDVQASNLVVSAPDDSPNTDGIHVTGTKNIRITNSNIGTGDDCISIVSGSQNVTAKDIKCGPGHGISIGSLGSENSKAYVSGVTVDGATISGTTNGVRIKTWQGGSGSATNIKFKNIQMYNVKNPIIIDQYYCDQDKPCSEQKSAVQVKNVVYQNIKGTSATNIAIKFDCSKSFPCQGIVLQDVNLQKQGGKAAEALCNNVKLSKVGVVSPQCP